MIATPDHESVEDVFVRAISLQKSPRQEWRLELQNVHHEQNDKGWEIDFALRGIIAYCNQEWSYIIPATTCCLTRRLEEYGI
jgi:hypothetical protein